MSELRTPKGTVDLNPQEAITRDKIVSAIKSVFVTHAGVPISTPMFELRDILLNKYGEDTKLIYNIEDQGGDLCSLRYDLTVPFSRYLCMNRIQKLRRYQIGNVFRRDNPSYKTGRLREFTQADFDICGSNLPMVNDAEIVKMISDIFQAINLPYSLKIKVNDRRILMGLLKVAGIPQELRGTACSTIDKVEKLTKAELTQEFTTKGLNTDQIQSILNFMNIKGTNEEIIVCLKNTNKEDAEFQTAVDEMVLLFRYLEIYKVANVVFDLSLARGLDYYTGLIIEAVYENCEFGSVAGGGRYDNLCSSLSNDSLKVPCVGFSIGITRLLYLSTPQEPSFDIFVGSGHELQLEDRLMLLNSLWSKGLRCETFHGKRVNYKEQIEFAKKNNFRFALFTGTNEIAAGVFSLIDLKTMNKQEIKRSELELCISELFKNQL